MRREGPLYVCIFAAESPIIVMDDAPAEVQIGGQRFPGQVISVRGGEVAVGIEDDLGQSVDETQLVTKLWCLPEALRKRCEEVLDGQRSADARLGGRLVSFAPASTRRDGVDLNWLPSPCAPNDGQVEAMRVSRGSDVRVLQGPPGTGKTQGIVFLVAALLLRKLRVLVAWHANVAKGHAIAAAAKLSADSEDYQRGKLARYRNVSPNSNLP